MSNNYHDFLSEFCIVGINYRKSDVIIRSRFSLTAEQCHQLLSEVVNRNMPGGFVISTCNRTEVYGICSSPHELIELLCLHTQGRIKDFIEHGYTLQGTDAIEHLFKMAAGIDSQIIGDHEILSQLKTSVKTAKRLGCINSFLERVVNFAIHSSKRIKTETQLSSGTVSVSYAAIEIIKAKVADLPNKKILLFGTGKFGNNVAVNLSTYLADCALSVCNRTDEKASLLAEKCKADFIAYDNLPAAVDDADVIIVSTSAESYSVLPSFFITQKKRLVLDLSIPQNVDPAIKNIPGINLMNVDEISVILHETVDNRKMQLPRAIQIISETIDEFLQWYKMQANNYLLSKIKSQLILLTDSEKTVCNERQIQKTVSLLAVQLRKENNKGCQYIHALNNYFLQNYDATA